MSVKINEGAGVYDAAAAQATAKSQANLDKVSAEKTAAAGLDTQDTYEKGAETVDYTQGYSKVKAMKADFGRQVAAFNKMVEALFSRQAGAAQGATFDLLEAMEQGGLKARLEGLNIDEATRAEAQAMVAEDGYWGVEQTANRIVDFAKAISGGDSSKIALLREAVDKGFAQAESLWGDTLPDISQKTRQRINELFDEWQGVGATAETEA